MGAQQQQTAALSALKDNPQATVHTIEMIQQIERGELPIEDVMQMQRDFEKEQAAATRAPFPTEDTYREQLFEQGAVPVFVHLLDLCAAVTEASEANSTLRDWTVWGVAESLQSQSNMQNDQVINLVAPLSALLQGGPSGFPVSTTTMNLAIQATSELIRALAVQRQIKLVSQITDPAILQCIRPYLRDDDIFLPMQPDKAVPSLMCTSRFVMGMAALGPAFVSRMEKAGFVDTLQAVQPRNARIKQILLGCFMMMGRTPSKARECDRCSKKEDPAKPFMMCSRCKARRYCSRQCQVEAWKGAHSRECKNLVAAQAQIINTLD